MPMQKKKKREQHFKDDMWCPSDWLMKVGYCGTYT
jgi:hypothetical protein